MCSLLQHARLFELVQQWYVPVTWQYWLAIYWAVGVVCSFVILFGSENQITVRDVLASMLLYWVLAPIVMLGAGVPLLDPLLNYVIWRRK